MIGGARGAARISVASNAFLIMIKVAAGAITGSIAILTEAVHSAIDMSASVIALVSIGKAEEPADAEHPYGHEKMENLAAAIEGVLILLGAAVIVYTAVRRIVVGGELQRLRVGIAIVVFSAVANTIVSTYLGRQARKHDSPALAADAAHLRADVLTSLGVLGGLVLVESTGNQIFDPIAALAIAAAILVAGARIVTRSSRVLVDEAPPPAELRRIEAAIEAARLPEVAGYHKLRARRAGRLRHIDLHVQFKEGTTLERAHALAHHLRSAIEAELPRSDVLIHVEPETSVREPSSEPASGADASGPGSSPEAAGGTSSRARSEERRAPDE